jgi:hypothetical protein
MAAILLQMVLVSTFLCPMLPVLKENIPKIFLWRFE